MTLNYTGRRSVLVAKQTERGKFAKTGGVDIDPAKSVPQFQGQQSQHSPRDDHKYDRANIGGGRGDDIPAKTPEA